MITIAGYQIAAQIYESANSLVYRGYREQDNRPVILKVLREDYPTPTELTQYKQEYEITHNLNLEGVVKAYSLEKYQNTLVIIFEDFGGQSLNILLNQQKFTLQEFLHIGIKIAEGLSSLHAANIIHKDINPSNIVFNPAADQLKLIDFGISTVLTRESPTLKNPNVLEGTLAYISPEQTGRINRSLDYRTDFYSLGVTFYELLTHQLPFETTDPLELVHCHIAKQPVPPHLVKGEQNCPKAVSDIVMKLMAKTAEERYQSPWGMKADLEKCMAQLQSQGKILEFSLASQDIADKFQIPQKLYGREGEVATLLAAFERVAVGEKGERGRGGEGERGRRGEGETGRQGDEGTRGQGDLGEKKEKSRIHNPSALYSATESKSKIEMMLVSGYAGIGKSALVKEIYKPITQSRGYFISGKFDQYQRDIPYYAVIQAFTELVKQLLTETEAQLKGWRKKLEAAVGANGQLIIDVIPEVELIVGKQPAVPEIPAAESQNRFNLVFQNFIRVFTQPEHPLVMFLDDLQWADAASLKLMQLLMTAPDLGYLFLIGAYRDNEVSGAHSLMLTIDAIRQAGTIVNQIYLSPLNCSVVTELIADTLKVRSKVKPLAELVLTKTNGNPFFVREFFKSIYAEKLLQFDHKNLSWQWDLGLIKAREITNNVVELMADKIQKLPDNAQQILKLAAIIGNQFELETLAIVSKKSPREAVLSLHEAMAEGLVLPKGDAYKSIELDVPQLAGGLTVEYQFVHDRIQQAAYSLIPEVERRRVQQQVGQLMLHNTPSYQLEEKIFDIVNQLNFGSELINFQSERDELAQLNLMAGKKARASAAYESALRYLEIGIELLRENSWQTQYNLTLKLYETAAEAAYLSGDFEQMERLAQVVLQQASTPLDKVKVYEVKIQAYIAQNQLLLAINTGLELLKLLGVNFPAVPNKLNILLELVKTKLALAGKKIEQLKNLPIIVNPYKKAAMSILSMIDSPCYIAATNLLPLVIFKKVNLSVKYGNSSTSAFAYAAYGVILCGLLGDIETGYQFGQLALSLLSRFDAQAIKCKTSFSVNSFIRIWKEHVSYTLKPLLDDYQIGLETGDFNYAAGSIHTYSQHLYQIGKQLTVVEREMTRGIKQHSQLNIVVHQKIYLQAVLNLMGNSENPCYLIGEYYDEEKMLPLHQQSNHKTAIFIAYFQKLILCYLFEDYLQAMENASLVENYLDAALASLSVAIFFFYSSLAKLAVYTQSNRATQKHLLNQVKANQKKMKKWAHYAPMNFLHKFYLVEAERHRVLGQYTEAMDNYDRAISLANEHEYLNEEALAYELAAKFYLAKGNKKVAETYMKQARYCYVKWGATAKVKYLELKYSQLLATVSKPPIISEINNEEVTISSETSQEVLDLKTLIKTSQALSQETDLGKLLETLMKFVIENAGAQKGFLILSKSDQLAIEAEGKLEGGIKILQSFPVQKSDDISLKIVNSVYIIKENVVLNNACFEGIFASDNYIISNQIKSVLCSPILSQGKLIGVIYLENNLVVNAFTDDRLEVLKLICSQAAISIENALLRQKEENQVFEYQVGGSLTTDAPTYVVRQADFDFYQSLKSGKFCYVLNSRHMGKSSLRVRTMNRLQADGIVCASVDLTAIGSKNITVDQWYAGMMYSLVNSLKLSKKFDFRTWWRTLDFLSPVQRFSEFINQVVLREVDDKIVFFVDEIDSTLGLNFNMDDFFAAIRSCYNNRADYSEYNRITFVLLGVASPSSLVRDKNCTPFNIGTAIALSGFQLHEVQPLVKGLAPKYSNPQALLKEVLAWTGGQPFLTQKICNLILNSQTPITEGKEAEWLENLVRTEVIENWESKDDPEHLKTIRNRLLRSESTSSRLLEMYQQILQKGEILADDSPEQMELLLSGLVCKRQSKLKVYNRIYEAVFDCGWVERTL
ncbi:MAG: AAA family ATPase [Xenococcaceae cyanobacterium]